MISEQCPFKRRPAASGLNARQTAAPQRAQRAIVKVLRLVLGGIQLRLHHSSRNVQLEIVMSSYVKLLARCQTWSIDAPHTGQAMSMGTPYISSDIASVPCDFVPCVRP